MNITNSPKNQVTSQLSKTPHFRIVVKDLEDEVTNIQGKVSSLIERLAPFTSRTEESSCDKPCVPTPILPQAIDHLRALTTSLQNTGRELDILLTNLEL